jgi:hypothetical protein
LVAIPFCLIFEASGADKSRNILILLLQFIRLIQVKSIFSILDKIKRKNLAKSNIIKLILLYYLMAHLVACIFIYIGNMRNNINESWFIKVPAPYT